MSILSSIFTAIRGGAREVGESIVDKNAVRIFEQEIKDAENALAKARQDLAQVMAKEMEASRNVAKLTADVQKYEGYVSQALNKGDESLALEIAEKIAETQSELEIQIKAQTSFSAHVTKLKAMIKKTTRALMDMKRQLTLVKTTESVHKATKSISNSYVSGSSSLLGAKASLDRIKSKQQNFEDKMKANELLEDEFNGKDLEEKLKAAGIVESNSKANDILAKLKAKNNS